MKLFLCGVMHASPICRDLYQSRLGIMLRDQGAPAFIAVEAAPHLFRETVMSQRTVFRDLAMADSQFTQYGQVFIDTLAKCIGFEADAHTDIYGEPGPSILWLDQYRDEDQGDQGCSSSLGRNYYLWFKKYLGDAPCVNVQDAFSRIHHGIYCSSQTLLSPEETYRRDALWAELIKGQIEHYSSNGYAIVTVGLDHLASDPKSVLSLLFAIAKCEAIDVT